MKKNKSDKKSEINLDIEEIRKRKEKFQKNKEEIEKRFKNYLDAINAINGLEIQLAEYVKKRLDDQKMTCKNENDKKEAIEKTSEAFERYLKSKGLRTDKANKKHAKEFYTKFVKAIYNNINQENINEFKSSLNEKIDLLNIEIERYVRELEIEYGISEVDKKIEIGELEERKLSDLNLDVSLLSKLIDIIFIGFFINAKDPAKKMVEEWNDKHYDLLYNTITKSNHISVLNIINDLNRQFFEIFNQIEQKLDELEKIELKKTNNTIQKKEI